MTITLCSIFRNSAHYVDRWLDQIAGLRKLTDVNVVATYGDSTDNTYGMLLTSGAEMDLSECSHGGPNFGSVDHPPRWDQIAKVVRHTLDRIADPGEALVWVESDLIWHPDDLMRLVADLSVVTAVAPQVLHADTTRWYDTWGYRKQGKQFNGQPPYWEGEPNTITGLVKIDSCGSCFATRTDYERIWSGHWPYNDPELWLDPTVTIRHP